ncbi:MAG: hypothetical protein QOE22_758 [Candidatus Parcubacteria bacterium]|jgi:hypothetical protein|nr:hypothetical protein [Candidatus Parcubacteria bacterium]
MYIRVRTIAAVAWDRRWDLVAYALAFVLVAVALLVAFSGAYNPPAPDLRLLSQIEAERQCGGTALRDVTRESGGNHPVYVCGNGTLIDAYQ